MIVLDKAWNKRALYLRGIGTIFNIALSYFVLFSLMTTTLVGQMRVEPKTGAAACSLPTVITSTIEITPNSADNIIDCSGQDITIQSGGVLVLKSYSTPDTSFSNDGGVILKVGNLTVDVGGKISADGQGYAPGALDGGSAGASTGLSAGSGGGNGGAGGTGNTVGGAGNVVGSTGSVIGNGNKEAPLALGGAGGNAGGGGLGGNGGGAIKIEASGAVTVNGSITADGLAGSKSADNQTSGGGGAGGSIWIIANTLAGTGTVTAKGGGTDQTASYYGGGGGGGRIAMVALTSSTYTAGGVSVAQGTGSQNGGVGTLVGPGVKPLNPTILRFYEKNSTAGKVDRELFVGEHTAKTALTFASNIAGTNEKIEIELRKKSDSFQNAPTNAQTTVVSNKTCLDIPNGTGVTISTYCGYVEVTTGLTTSTEYKWQARVINSVGIASDWVQYGENATSDKDFVVVGPASQLLIVEGNNQSVTVGLQTPVRPKARVVDAAGFGVPFYGGYAWTLLTGGGTITNGMTTADKWGELTVDWTLGTVAGIDNNTIKVRRGSTPVMEVIFTASAVPGAIDHYKVVAPSTFTLVNNPFSYTITALDVYNNPVPFSGDLTLTPVGANDVNTPGLGTLSPNSVHFTETLPAWQWYSSRWLYRKKLTFDNTAATLGATASTLENFPLLVSLNASNFDFSKAKANGDDIRFTRNDGTTLLAYEIEKWDSVAQEAFVWVTVPSISAESTTEHVYMYYGNPDAQSAQDSENVWDAGYRLVQHLEESSGTVALDSSEYNNDGTKVTETEPASAVGKIGKGMEFDGVNDVIRFQHNSSISFGAPAATFTLEAWVKTTSATTPILAKARPSSNTHMEYYLMVVDGKVQFNRLNNTPAYPAGLNSFSGNTVVNDGQWHHVVFTSTGASEHVIYVDGVVDTVDTTTWTYTDTNTQGFDIGKYDNYTFSDSFYTGTMDEVRLSAVSRTAGWVAAQYKTVTGGFVSVSGEETPPAGIGTIQVNPGSQSSITISNATYTYAENMKVKVEDPNGKVGYSNAILFATSVGTCPAITIDVDQIWDAKNVPGGVYDCRGLGQMKVESGHTLFLKSYNNGDTDYTNDYGVTLLVDALLIEQTASMSAEGLGYPAKVGVGGGVHGGFQVGTATLPYGNVYEPISLGSGQKRSYTGRATTGAGGGAVKLQVTTDAIINGTLSVSGENATNGHSSEAGAGGSLWLTVPNLSGTGFVKANGGKGLINSFSETYGGGTGGRIAVYYQNNTLPVTNIQAYGGQGGGGWSGAGTIYLENTTVDGSHAGSLYIDNNNNNGLNAGVPHGNYQFKEISVTRKGHVEFMDAGGASLTETDHSKLTVLTGNALVGDSTKPLIKVSGVLDYTGGGILTVDGVDLGINGKANGIQDITIGGGNAAGVTLYAKTWYYNTVTTHSFGNILTKSNGIFSLTSYQNGTSSIGDDFGVNLHVTSLTIDAGGMVTAAGLGYPVGVGVGGGIHGGYQVGISTLPYGNVYEPVTLGSGMIRNYAGRTSTGNGGGAVKLTVDNTLTVNGTLTVAGISATNGHAAEAGAGGSLWVRTNALAGTGLVTASGGMGLINSFSESYGGGTGGRIAVYYASKTLPNANIQAYGGRGGGGWSGAGTIYLEDTTTDQPKAGKLIVDNNNNNGLFSGVPHGSYQFKEIQATRYGHVEFMDAGGASTLEGDHSKLTITSGAGMVGDATKPQIKVSGTLMYTSAEILSVDGVNVGINGKTVGIDDITIGGVFPAGLTLYAKTWYHSNLVPYSLGDLLVKPNGTMSMVSFQNGATNYNDDYGVHLNANSITVNAGGSITASGLGYPIRVGVGGGIHGGFQVGDATLPYGDVYEPLTLGSSMIRSYSGWTDTALGGGSMKLQVAGVTHIDGTLTVSGMNATNGHAAEAGAGGSLWLTTNTLEGIGYITSNGGQGKIESFSETYGGGTGGRIAIYYANNTFPIPNVQAYGGRGGGGWSGAGTIYLENTTTDQPKAGTLIIDNNNNNGLFAGVPHGDYQFKQIQATRYGHVEFMDAGGVSTIEANHSKLTITSGAGMLGDATQPQIKVSGVLAYTSPDILEINGVNLGINGKTSGVDDITIGGSFPAGVTLYAKTWYHSNVQPYTIGDILVKSNGTVSMVAYQNGGTNYNDDFGVYLNASSITVDAGGVITADGLGYPVYQGVASGLHGGYQYTTDTKPYGDVFEPVTLGSAIMRSYAGWTSTGAGGGAMRLNVSGATTVNGAITANGIQANGEASDGGAGGSIWLTTQTLSGTGIIRTNGGLGKNGYGGGAYGGGTGGRIAVYVATNAFPVGNIQSYGNVNGGGWSGAGTIYIENTTTDQPKAGTLIIDNNNNNGLAAGVAHGVYGFKEIKLQRYGHVDFIDNGLLSEVEADHAVLNISGGGLTGDATKPEIKVSGVLSYTGGDTFVMDGFVLGVSGKVTGIQNMTVGGGLNNGGLNLYARNWYHNLNNPYQFGTVTVTSKGTIRGISYQNGVSSIDDDYGISVTLANLTVQTGGSVNADGLGYPFGVGVGSGVHGGYQFNLSTPAYGNLYEPITLGSGGIRNYAGWTSTGAGGGAMKLFVSNTTVVDGTISSNGINGNSEASEAGAGGSIWLDTGSISGVGSIVANGGTGTFGYGSGAYGGGAGGRIALYYGENAGFNFGNIQAFGGRGGGAYSGPGTIYLENVGVQPAKKGDLIITNNSKAGRGQDFEAIDYEFDNLTIGSNVTVHIKSDLTSMTSGYVRPIGHQATSETATQTLLQFNEGLAKAFVNEKDATKNGILQPSSEKVAGKFGNGQKTITGYGIQFPEVPLPSEWTIDMWVKFPLPTTNEGWRTLIAKNGGNYHPLIIHADGTLGLYNLGWYPSGYNTNTLTGWNHIATTGKNGQTQFFVNGQLVGSVATVITQPVSVLGNVCASGGCYQQTGEFDEVRISNIAFTEADIAQMAGATSAYTVIDSTVALWHLDEDVNKVYTSSGTAITSSLEQGSGVYGSGAYFNGTNQYINLPSSPSSYVEGFTFEVWAKPTRVATYPRLFDFHSVANVDNVIMYIGNGNTNLGFVIVNDGVESGRMEVTNAVTLNEWHHYAVTIAGNGNMRLYKDGVQIASTTATLPKVSNRTLNYIGRSAWGSDSLYQGEMDEVHVFTRALSPAEIYAHSQGLTLEESLGVMEQTVGRGTLFKLSGNFLLETGAVIEGSGIGFPSERGAGLGQSGIGYSGGGGGSNGGQGGAGQSDGQNNPALGGTKYGDQLLPLTIGSGGGAGATGAKGGAGGGSLGIIARGSYNEETRQYLDGNVVIHGTIRMNGTTGLTGSPGGGGGAGGSILIHGNTCTIDGTLQAQGGEGGNSDIDGGSGGGGRVSVLYNVGPCEVTGTVNVSEGQPSDPLNYGAQVGQVGTYPPEPNSVPWPSQYKDQFEVYDDAVQTEQQSKWKKEWVASTQTKEDGSVLGIVESVIPLGGIINGTTVTLKADAYDAGARPVSPKHLKIQVEIKPVTESFDGVTALRESNIVTFYGGQPVLLNVTVNDLEMGTSYKWRVRTVNVDNNLYSEWQDFGSNGNAPDFTITTVAQLEATIDKSIMNLSEYGTLTIVARNQSNEVDTSYRGTVRFTVNSVSADLPADYTFTAADAGQHTFPNSVKFYEGGNFTIVAEDTINPALMDTVPVSVQNPNVPYIFISAARTKIVLGESTRLTWGSNLLTNLSIDQGIGSVEVSGSMWGKPVSLGVTTYTITGQTSEGQIFTASVSIETIQGTPDTSFVDPTEVPTVLPTETTTPRITVTPVTQRQPSCPTIYLFEADNTIIKPGGIVLFRWDVRNADKISIDAFGSGLSSFGSSSVAIPKSQVVTLYASKGSCVKTEKVRVDVVGTLPWEGAGAMLMGLLLLETASLQVGVMQGNLWLALLAFIDRKKKRTPWGVVYDAVTKDPLVRAVVRLWDAEKGTLVDTVVTDANGIFKLTPKEGKYVVKVTKAGYTFPSKLVSGENDTGYTNVYRGEVVEIGTDSQLVMISIPGDPEKKGGKKSRTKQLLSFLESIFAVVNPILLVAGFVYSIVVTVMYPLTFNFVVLGLYMVTFAFKVWGYMSKPKTHGVVRDVEGKIVSGLEIGIYDTEFRTLVARTFTNKKGAYNFVVRNEDYDLQIMDEGYKMLDKRATKDGLRVKKVSGASNVRLITENLLVYQVRKELKTKSV